MIAEHWYAILLLVFVTGYLVGDLARRAIDAERERRDRRTRRALERTLRPHRQSPRTPW